MSAPGSWLQRAEYVVPLKQPSAEYVVSLKQPSGNARQLPV